VIYCNVSKSDSLSDLLQCFRGESDNTQTDGNVEVAANSTTQRRSTVHRPSSQPRVPHLPHSRSACSDEEIIDLICTRELIFSVI